MANLYLLNLAAANLKVALDLLQVVTIDAVEDVPSGNETALMQAVTMHPTAIGLCVGPWIKEWRAYTGGILTVPGQSLCTVLQCIFKCHNAATLNRVHRVLTPPL